MAGPLGRARHQRARPRPGRAAVLQPDDVPLPVGRGAARREHVRLHRQRHLRPLQAAAGLRRLRADRLRRLRHPLRELRDQGGHPPGGAHPAQHRQLPPPARRGSAGCSTGGTRCPPPIPPTTSGPSGSSSSSTRRGRPTRRRRRQLVPQVQDRARQRAGDRRLLRAHPTRGSSSGRWSSGSSGSPSTPSGCSSNLDDRARWTGPTRPPRRSGTGSGAPKGAEIDFAVAGDCGAIRVFTTRPDTLFGATFMVLAPEHPLVAQLTTDAERAGRRGLPRPASRRRTWCPARWATRRRPACSPAAYAINPATGEKIPVWIADYVLMEYGTGAIMAVPAHDERDFEFARKFGLPIVRVLARAGQDADAPLPEAETDTDGVRAGATPGRSTGRPASEAHRDDHRAGSSARGTARRRCSFRLHDWCISRQRYWGPPIPIIYCDELRAGAGARRQDLPVVLPADRRLPPRRLRRLAAGPARGVVLRALPDLRHSAPGARPTCPTPSSTRPGTSCATRAPTSTTAPSIRRGPGRWLPGHDVHRRQRARGAAPAVLALHHHGAARPRARRLRGAVHASSARTA